MTLKHTYSRVFAPATVANVGPGFDIFGMALENPGDEVEVQVTPGSGIRIVKITGDDGMLPKAAEKNTVTVAMNSLYQQLQLNCGLQVTIHKKMPVGSGMGSSAASSIAGVTRNSFRSTIRWVSLR